MGRYYRVLCLYRLGDHVKALDTLKEATAKDPSRCYPNSLYAIVALTAALDMNPEDANAHYLLGNIYYEKRQYEPAIENWEKALELNPEFPTVWRNIALAYFNKRKDSKKAVEYMEKAFDLDKTDSRVLMELDQLYKRLRYPHEMRLRLLEEYPDLTAKRDDLILERITLLNQLGRFQESKELLDSHIFHPWEGGEGKVPAQYQTARVELAKKAMNDGRYSEAIYFLEECLEYPCHLGEGKLYGAQENDFYYLLGLCYRHLGSKEKAEDCFFKATEGPTEPVAAMYYNDAKPDKIFYAGMAYRELGQEDKARAYFNRLVNYGCQHYHDDVKMDYFAVSLPDLLIWDGDLNEDNLRHCLYMLALGEYGLGNHVLSEKYLKQLIDMDRNHQGAMAFTTFKRLRADQ
ncbi:MAG: tetratricopeptide repeat protein, partial [Muribaculaceae bacterium]|nr:tetratricopeptide repeat protein [Muribaculaceae bacterium]